MLSQKAGPREKKAIPETPENWPTGRKGDPGDIGPQGPIGLTGADGLGIDGANGSAGFSTFPDVVAIQPGETSWRRLSVQVMAGFKFQRGVRRRR